MHCSNFKYGKIQRLKSCFFSQNNNKTPADFNISTIFISKSWDFMFEWSISLQMYVLAWWRRQSIFIFLGLRDHDGKISLIWNKCRKTKDCGLGFVTTLTVLRNSLVLFDQKANIFFCSRSLTIFLRVFLLISAADSFDYKTFFVKVGLNSKSKDQLAQVFGILDQDRSGFIEEDELK